MQNNTGIADFEFQFKLLASIDANRTFVIFFWTDDRNTFSVLNRIFII